MSPPAPNGLRYVTDEQPGIRRRRRGKGFSYHGPGGEHLTDEQTLQRIGDLVIPPAWEDVWICPTPDGHLQATGRDHAGRKQYRYHRLWGQHQTETKFGRLPEFADALPRLRRQVDQDLRQRTLSWDRVVAAAVRLMELTLIRVGHEQYAKQNNTYGVATLERNHAEVSTRRICLNFTGKGGKDCERDIDAPRVARVLRRCEGLPGERLFEYLDENDQPVAIDADDVNTYLRQHAIDAASSKDFRTWGATVLAASRLARLERASSDRQVDRQIVRVIKEVAADLGNTPATCRKYYVHPTIIERYRQNTLVEHMNARPRPGRNVPRQGLSAEEQAVRRLLDDD